MATAALVPAMLAAGGGRAPATAHQASQGIPGRAAAGTTTTVAGGPGGPAWATTVAAETCGVTSAHGLVYFAGGAAVREVSRTGWLTPLAGTGGSGHAGDGGPASEASLYSACGVVRDHAGNLVIADAGAQRVRVIAARAGTFYGQPMTAGDIYTVAGTGIPGFSGDGGPAAQAMLSGPIGVAVDRVGNLLVTDAVNGRVRVVAARSGTFYGTAMTAGDIYTIAGGGPGGLGDGRIATKATIGYPFGVAVDAAGNVVIGASFNQRVRVIAARSGISYGRPMKARHIYTVAGNGTKGYSGDGGPATSAALFYPEGVALDAAGNLLIADNVTCRIRVVAARDGTFYGVAMTAGDIYTIAGNGDLDTYGDGGPATSAGISAPEGVAVDAAGNLFITAQNWRVRMVAAGSGTYYGQAVTVGDIYTIAGNGQLLFSGDGGPATSAELFSPQGVSVDAAGNLLIAATRNNRIRVVAHQTGTYYGRAMTARHIYTVAGSSSGVLGGFSGDGRLATKAELNTPTRVVTDAVGNLLIADTGNNRIRVVAHQTGTWYGRAMTAGHIYTIAGTGNARFSGDGGPATRAGLSPTGIAVDAAGNLLIADTGNNRIRVVAQQTGTWYGQAMTADHIYTIAGTGSAQFSGDGGPATSAGLNSPSGTALDQAGNLLIADISNNRIRVVAQQTGTWYGQAMTAGDIYTVAGDGDQDSYGDGGPATSAALNRPWDVAADGAGNLLIADTYNHRVRVVAEQTGTWYGQAMTAGDIYTVTDQVTLPGGVAAGPAGSLLVADTYNNRIREVAG